MSHTPGPWMASPFSSAVGLGVVGQGGRVICTIAIAPGFDPSNAKDAGEFSYCAELGANARLIAAAPTLLEALEVIAGGCVDVSDTAIIVGDGAKIVMQQVRAVINAAKGGQQ